VIALSHHALKNGVVCHLCHDVIALSHLKSGVVCYHHAIVLALGHDRSPCHSNGVHVGRDWHGEFQIHPSDHVEHRAAQTRVEGGAIHRHAREAQVVHDLEIVHGDAIVCHRALAGGVFLISRLDANRGVRFVTHFVLGHRCFAVVAKETGNERWKCREELWIAPAHCQIDNRVASTRRVTRCRPRGCRPQPRENQPTRFALEFPKPCE